MKKLFALVIAMIALMVMIPSALAAGTTVYVSVSVDGKLEVSAQPVEITELTADSAVKAAHAAYYSGGESGYASGIDATYNMFLVTQAWGIAATPYIIVNGMPIGADPANPTADTAPVQSGDNIIICTSSDTESPATPVSLTASVSGGSAGITATAWTLDFTTFTYSSAPLANTVLIDPVTGASLGTTDAEGNATVAIPESGVAAIAGLAAINLNAAGATGASAETSAPALPAPAEGAAAPTDSAAAASADAAAAPVPAADVPLFYPPTTSMLIAMAVVLIPVFIIIAIKMTKQSRLDKKASAGGRQR